MGGRCGQVMVAALELRLQAPTPTATPAAAASVKKVRLPMPGGNTWLFATAATRASDDGMVY